MSHEVLTVLLGGQRLGEVEQSEEGKLRLVYDPAWRDASSSQPLSISMPLALPEHGDERIRPFLAGLLPDNPNVLQAWGNQFGISPRNPFALLSFMGEDCAGAAQFIRAERLDEVLDDQVWNVKWLEDYGVQERLARLRQDRTSWRSSQDTGQFSLSGAQPKTALLRQDGRWGVPAGRVPTTHILKPPIPDFDGHVENEHFCLQLAMELSLPVATSTVMRFGPEIAIVVERYDRVSLPGAGAQPIKRLHQEDLCQAVGVMPSKKYQNDGGPTPAQVVELLWRHSSRPVEDVARFLDALVFNWLIAGTDAHAKNYSLLYGDGGQVRLAPLYDLASALPYPHLESRRLTLAMKVGSKYRVREVNETQWRKMGADFRLDPDVVVERVASMVRRMPDAAARVRSRAENDGLDHEVIARLAQCISARAEECAERLNRRG